MSFTDVACKPTCNTLPHVRAEGHVIRTSACVLGGVLRDERGRQAQELTTTVHQVALSAPVLTCQKTKHETNEIWLFFMDINVTRLNYYYIYLFF